MTVQALAAERTAGRRLGHVRVRVLGKDVLSRATVIRHLLECPELEFAADSEAQVVVVVVDETGAGQIDGRETRVLTLLAEGSDTREIARRLNYSERTVKSIIGDITTRFGLRNRSHAVAYALRAGLI